MSAPPRPVAFVTGASRGIGRATALALADAGFDVAVSARTMVDGTATLGPDDATLVPGGLDTTVAGVEAAGRAGFAVAMDVLDRPSVLAAADAVVARFGRVDVLVNNAIHQGPGSMSPLLELDEDEWARMFEGNVFAPLALTRHLLPRFIDQGGATVVNMISATAHRTPPGPIGKGGWGVAYAMTKAALERMAPVLNVEHGADGLVVHSVDPGFVRTERAEARAASQGDRSGHTDHFRPAPAAAIGSAVAWLVTDPAGPGLAGEIVHAQRIALRQGLVPDWRR